MTCIFLAYLVFSEFSINFVIFALLKASIGSGSCGLNLDWSEMLADYEGNDVISICIEMGKIAEMKWTFI